MRGRERRIVGRAPRLRGAPDRKDPYLDTGCDDFASKPIECVALTEMVARYTSGKTRPATKGLALSQRAASLCRSHPVILREFAALFDAEDGERIAPCNPAVRILTGAEEVHLASGRARRTDLQPRRTRQEHAEHGSAGCVVARAIG